MSLASITDTNLCLLLRSSMYCAVHWDSLAAWMGKAAWSFLGYCTPGTRSTALPRFPPSAIPQSEEPAELRAKFADLFDKGKYHDVEVEVGDFSFFGRASRTSAGSRTRRGMRSSSWSSVSEHEHREIRERERDTPPKP